MGRFVVGVSGASGVILARKAVHAMLELGHTIEFVITPSALYTASLEMGKKHGSAPHFLEPVKDECRSRLNIHPIHDMASAIASGSFLTDGMLIIPCSMATLAAVSCGLADNVLRRAADVMLKERRPLVIVPRETPLSEIHLEHMLRLTKMGAVIVPPVPAWYTEPKSLDDVENFIVGKALDALRVPHNLFMRWKSPKC